MGVLQIIIVMWTKDVGRDGGSELVTELVVVGTVKVSRRQALSEQTLQQSNLLVLNIHQSFAVGIAEITSMRGTCMNLCLVDGVGDFVWEDWMEWSALECP